MTYKAAWADLPMGGAKAVIDADPARAKTPALLEHYARAVRELEGRFVTGGDLGIDQDDVRFMARFSRAFAHASAPEGPDASDLTAIGVFAAIRTVAARLDRPLAGLAVAVQGTGEVGGRLARRLAAAGARVIVADVSPARAQAVAAETGAEIVAPEEILAVPCDVFSPNAAGGGIDEAAAGRLACRAICGAANNPLASAYVGYDLAARRILYAPDFVVSAGGILSLLYERGEVDERGIVARVERIGDDLAELLEAADREGVPAFRLAERRVEEKLAAARAARR
jgi:leucine dehydrogenase